MKAVLCNWGTMISKPELARELGFVLSTIFKRTQVSQVFQLRDLRDLRYHASSCIKAICLIWSRLQPPSSIGEREQPQTTHKTNSRHFNPFNPRLNASLNELLSSTSHRNASPSRMSKPCEPWVWFKQSSKQLRLKSISNKFSTKLCVGWIDAWFTQRRAGLTWWWVTQAVFRFCLWMSAVSSGEWFITLCCEGEGCILFV